MSAALRIYPLISVLTLTPLAAQDTEGDSVPLATQCIAPGDIPPRQEYGLREGQPVHVEAEQFEGHLELDRPVHLERGVRVTHGDMQMETDSIVYNPVTGRVEFPSPLEYRDALFTLKAESAWYDMTGERGRFEGVRYHVAGAEATGSAETVVVPEPGRSILTSFDFTTCDPTDPDWQIRSSSVRIDHERGVGTARNARLVFKGVPVLYSPWLSFSVDNSRKSGFLYPRLGISRDDGLDIAVPWYWNIAPNQDATLTPRWIYNRGAMLGAEYRLLTGNSYGQVRADYLPNDDRTGSDRYHAQLDYRIRLAPKWSGYLDLNRASDDTYFSDLGGDLEQSSVQFLRSQGGVRGRGRHWRANFMADGFQVLDETVPVDREPYRRLPRIDFDGDWPLPGRFDFSMDSEVVNFHRDEGDTAARADLLPRLHWSWLHPGAFLKPSLGWRSTSWRIDEEEGGTRTETRNLPIASVDGGLIFERSTAGGNIQTLEPRLFYLYVPHEDQQDLPRFDTSELTFGFSQLFHHNRFTGPDRQADANQLAAAVTSRLLDPATGLSRLEMSLGQIFFFRDQRVQLSGVPERSQNFSAYVGEVIWRPHRALGLNAAVQWDPEDNELDVAAAGLSYRGRDSRQVSLGYRFRRDRVDQVDFRFRWPLGRTVNAIGRVNYSFLEDEATEILGGLEFESCCWALRLTARRWIKDRQSESRDAIFLELHLKGLGSLGRRPYHLFEDTY